MKQSIKITYLFALLLGFMACEKDDGIPAPTVDYTFETKNLSVTFDNQSTNSRYFSWDFGDGSTPLTSMEASHTYAEGGTYEVTLSVTGRDGSILTKTETVTVTAPVVENLVKGGKMNQGDEASWNFVTYTQGVTFSLTDGKMLAEGGSGGHAGIYQAIEVEGGKKYQLDMTVAGSGATDVWFEVYVGTAAPIAGQDYNDGGKRLAINTWAGCGKSPFNGNLSAISCDGKDGGVVSFPQSGTVYLFIRCGGSDLGANGISIDNVSLTETE